MLPAYDFNGDGVINDADVRIAKVLQTGITPMRDWTLARKTPVTMTIDLTDPDKAIHFTGTNVWGEVVEGYWGINSTSSRCPATEKRIDEQGEKIKSLQNNILTLEGIVSGLIQRVAALEQA
jgi:hypothetical protein